MKFINMIFILAVEQIIVGIIDIIFNISTRISISIGSACRIIVCLATISYFIVIYILKIKKERREDKMQIKELKTKIEKMSELDLEMRGNEGDRLLLMSLSQNFHEPLKISLLEKAVEEHHHVLSALILADLYGSGIEYEGKYVISQNREKAAEIYDSISHYDDYGVCSWVLGWFYENKLITDAKTLSDDERLTKAKMYYEESAKKEYAKAYNSLGKFSYYGYGGLEKNFTKALEYFTKAARCGDIYAIMNCGHISLNRYYEDTSREECLNEAETYFKKAASYKNAEGFLQLGIIEEIKMEKDINCINKAKEYYIKAFSDVKNQYSATAYYKLGKLINNNSSLQIDSDIISALGAIRFKDLSIECFTRAYEIFQNLDSNNGYLNGKYRKCFNELVEAFKGIA